MSTVSNAPYTLVDQYHAHDRACTSIFKLARLDEPNNLFVACAQKGTPGQTLVPIIFATTERAHSTDFLWYKKFGYRALPLPFVSVQRIGDDEFDPERFHWVEIRKADYLGDGNLVAMTGRPHPVNLQYQIDVWASTAPQLNQIRLAYRRLFGMDNLLAHTVNVGEPMNNIFVHVEMQSISDNSELEAQETGDKIFRLTITAVLKGYLQLPARLHRTVRKVETDVLETDSEGNTIDTLLSVLDEG